MTKSITLGALCAALLVAPGVARPADPPGSFKIPGTDTTMRVYGHIQLDTTLDMAGRQDVYNSAAADWSSYPALIPLDGGVGVRQENPQFYWTARTSRVGFTTSTPSPVGEVGTKVEADFNGAESNKPSPYTNSTYFRLRHAYGTLGRWLLIGQSWSTYTDLRSFADTVAFNPTNDTPGERQAQVRFTLALGPGDLLLAAENPANYVTTYALSAPGASDPNNYQALPDFVVGYVLPFSWGHVSARAVTLHYETPSAYKQTGAAQLSGSVKLFGDTLVWAVQGGAPGRYAWSSMGAGDQRAVANNHELLVWSGLAYHAGFTHVWSPEFRSNLVWAQTLIQDNDAIHHLMDAQVAAGGAANPQVKVPAYTTKNKRVQQLFVNTFWTVTKNFELGLEYEFAQREDFSNSTGTQHRVNATAHFNIY